MEIFLKVSFRAITEPWGSGRRQTLLSESARHVCTPVQHILACTYTCAPAQGLFSIPVHTEDAAGRCIHAVSLVHTGANIMYMYLPDAYLHSSMNTWNFISPLEFLDIFIIIQRWSVSITTSCMMGGVNPVFKAYKMYKVELFSCYICVISGCF